MTQIGCKNLLVNYSENVLIAMKEREIYFKL